MSHAHAGTPQWFQVNLQRCVGPVRDYSPQGGQGWTELTLTSSGNKRREGGRRTQWPVERVKSDWKQEKNRKKQDWNISVKCDLMGGKMNTEHFLWSTRERMTPLFLFRGLCLVQSRWHSSREGRQVRFPRVRQRGKKTARSAWVTLLIHQKHYLLTL